MMLFEEQEGTKSSFMLSVLLFDSSVVPFSSDGHKEILCVGCNRMTALCVSGPFVVVVLKIPVKCCCTEA